MSKIFASIKIITLTSALFLSVALVFIFYSSVVFGYTLLRGDWSYYADPMGESMVVYENTSDTAGELNAILTAMNTWDNAGARFKFTYGGSNTKCVSCFDNVNQIRWDFESDNFFWRRQPHGLVAIG